MNRIQLIDVYDLDGCIFDDRHRLPLIKPNPKKDSDYIDYHRAMHDDKVFAHAAVEISNSVQKGHKIAFITARPIDWVLNTRRQILDKLKLSESEYSLYMRNRDEEGLPAPQLKHRRIKDLLSGLAGNHKINKIYDDRIDVLEMYDGLRIAYGLYFNLFMMYHGGCFHYEDVKNKGIRTKNPWLTWRHFDGYRKSPWITDIDLNCGKDYSSSMQIRDHMISDIKKSLGIPTHMRFDPELSAKKFNENKAKVKTNPKQADDVLVAAAELFKERNSMYKDNADVVGKVMIALFPKGVKLETPDDFHMWHLFELLIVKLTRFSNTGLRHEDSIHDLCVYAAMIAPLINKHNIKTKGE